MLSFFLSGISVIGGGVVLKGGLIISKILIHRIQRKYKKYNIQKELLKSIDDLDFNNFQEKIYLVKQYDFLYKKQLFNKLKKKYKFNDKTTTDNEYFKRRFDIDYDIKQNELKEIVKREVERSLTRNTICIEDSILSINKSDSV